MLTSYTETLLGFGGTVIIALIGWAIRLESRLSVQTALHTALIDLINSRHDEVDRRLTRIENALNGAMKKYNSDADK